MLSNITKPDWAWTNEMRIYTEFDLEGKMHEYTTVEFKVGISIYLRDKILKLNSGELDKFEEEVRHGIIESISKFFEKRRR